MNGAEPFDAGRVLERVMIDPIAIVARMLRQVLDQLTHEYALAGNDNEPPEELLATALGNRLAQVIVNKDLSSAADRSARALRIEELAEYEDLLDRNSDLAAALGACDCWGRQVDCPICDGAGASGWALPDRQLFASYVRPAVRAITKSDTSSVGVGRRNEGPRREEGNPRSVHQSLETVAEHDGSSAHTGPTRANHRKESGDV